MGTTFRHRRGHPVAVRRLLDDFVGARQQRGGHGEAERLGRPEIDHQFIFGRHLHRQVGRPLAFEDAVHVTGGFSGMIGAIGTDLLEADRFIASGGGSAGFAAVNSFAIIVREGLEASERFCRIAASSI